MRKSNDSELMNSYPGNLSGDSVFFFECPVKTGVIPKSEQLVDFSNAHISKNCLPALV